MIAPRSNAFAATVLCAVAATCGAQTYFDLWFEAPSTVQAGETFTITVWSEASGDWTTGTGYVAYFSSCFMSVEVTGALSALAAISQATIHTNVAFDRGQPSGAWLSDVAAVNLLGFPPGGTLDNPIPFFSFDVTTTSSTGTLTLNQRLHSRSPSLVTWLVELRNGEQFFIGSADDNSVLTANPFTVRVIPAPAGVALLALGAIASPRRDPR